MCTLLFGFNEDLDDEHAPPSVVAGMLGYSGLTQGGESFLEAVVGVEHQPVMAR